MSWLDRVLCGLTRHQDAQRRAEHGRLFLRCACGWESPGWQVMKPPPVRRIVPWRIVRSEVHQHRRRA